MLPSPPTSFYLLFLSSLPLGSDKNRESIHLSFKRLLLPFDRVQQGGHLFLTPKFQDISRTFQDIFVFFKDSCFNAKGTVEGQYF